MGLRVNRLNKGKKGTERRKCVLEKGKESEKKRKESKNVSFGRKRAYSQIAKWCKTIDYICCIEIIRCGRSTWSTWNKANKSERWRTQGKRNKPMVE